MIFLEMRIIPKQDPMVHFFWGHLFFFHRRADGGLLCREYLAPWFRLTKYLIPQFPTRVSVSHVNMLRHYWHLQGSSPNPPMTHLLLTPLPTVVSYPLPLLLFMLAKKKKKENKWAHSCFGAAVPSNPCLCAQFSAAQPGSFLQNNWDITV